MSQLPRCVVNGAPLPVLAALLVVAIGPAEGAPGDPCERLFVPEGYRLTCTVEGGSARGWVARVAPSEGDAFGGLTELTLEPVEGPVDDEPELWLREQMTVDVTGVEHALMDLLEDPDSPLADVPLEGQARDWMEMMRALGQLPLKGCAEPVQLASEDDAANTYEIACSWQLGPFTHYMNVRLLQRDGESYVFHLRAANERRLRHLRAIASSF
jgi:hypothetical protein